MFRGVLNVMSEIGMQQAEQVLPERYLGPMKPSAASTRRWVDFLRPSNARESFGREVVAGGNFGAR